MTLDYPHLVTKLAVLDIVPTRHALRTADIKFGLAYWHWFFLAQPEPLPEHQIGADPVGWVRGRMSSGRRGGQPFDQQAVEVDGRTGYRVIATIGIGPVTGGALSGLPGWWLPAVAVVDASSGRLLRLTRYRGGTTATRQELRSVSDGGPDDFGFTPPDGLPVRDSESPQDDSRPGTWRWSFNPPR